MPNIKDSNGKITSEASTIRAYFGLHPNETLQEFMTELKALSPTVE